MSVLLSAKLQSCIHVIDYYAVRLRVGDWPLTGMDTYRLNCSDIGFVKIYELFVKLSE